MAISLDFVFTAINQVTATINQVGDSIGQLTRKGQVLREGFEDMNTQLLKLGQASGVMFGMASDAMNKAIKVGAEYEFVLAGISGALKGLDPALEGTTINFAELNDTIFSLAIKSGRTSIEIAKAGAYLVQTGLSLEDTQSVLTDAILLATVPGQDFEKVMSLLTSTMKSLNMSVEDASRVVDVFAGVSLATGVSDVDTMSRAIGLSSGSMNQYAISIEEVAGPMALLGDSFVIAAGGIAAFSLVGDSLSNLLRKSGEAGLFSAEAQLMMNKSLGEGAEKMGKVEKVLRFLRKEIKAGTITVNQINEAYGNTGTTAEGMTKLLTQGEEEFTRYFTAVNQAGIAQRNFDEISKSTKMRLSALNTVVEQMQIMFFSGLEGALTESLGEFFKVIGGPDGNRASNIMKEIGAGIGDVLVPALKLATEVLDDVLTLLEDIGPTGRQLIGIVAALAIGFLGLLAGVRILVPIFKLLIGVFGMGSTTAGLLVKTGLSLTRLFATIGGALGLAGQTLSVFVRGMSLLSRAFLPISGAIQGLIGVFKIFSDGNKSILDIVEGVANLIGSFLSFAAMLPTPLQPLFAVAAAIMSIVNGLQLWDDLLLAISDTMKFFGLGGFDMNAPVLQMGSTPTNSAGGMIVNNNVTVQGDAIGIDQYKDIVANGVETAQQIRKRTG